MNILSRKWYMQNPAARHNEYYGQPAFCTPEVKSLVARAIGIKRILDSTDIHFNDIALSRWDALHPGIKSLVGNAIAEANGGGISLSDTCCIAKAVARLIKEPKNV